MNKRQKVVIAVYIGFFIVMTCILVPWEYGYKCLGSDNQWHFERGSRWFPIFGLPSWIGDCPLVYAQIKIDELMTNLFVITFIFAILILATGTKKPVD